jgi:hypothetical protein
MPDDERPDSEKNVVDLFPEVSAPAVTTSNYGHHACQHAQIDLDRDTRLARCRRCGGQIEVFDWLVEHAGVKWDRMWHQFQTTQDAVKRLQRQREDLGREVKNLKSQAKRWRATVATMKVENPDVAAEVGMLTAGRRVTS